ncbi:MAG: Ig-like domain-containing protein [Bacteroidia bacterium]
MMRKIIVITLLHLNVMSAFAQLKWFGKFGWWGVDIGNDVTETLDGHYMVTGYTGSYTFGNSDVMVAKVNKTGWLMWVKNIGGLNNDIGKAIVSTSDSGFVIAGYTNTYGNGGYDGYLIKVNKTGDVVWQKTYGDTDWDMFNALQQTSDNGFVMTGYSYSNSKGEKDFWIVKTDSLGNVQWEKKMGGVKDDEFVSVEILHDGRIACFGTTYSFSDTKGNYCIYKTNNNGDSLFFKEFGTNNAIDIGYDFFERPFDSTFIIAGTSQSPFGSDTTYYHRLIVDSLCNIISDVKESNHNLKNQIITTNAYLNNQKYYAVYDLTGYGQGKREPGFYIFFNDWYFNGSTYGSSEDDFIVSCKRTSDKGLIAVGYTYGFNALQEDVFIVKLDSTTQYALNVVGVEQYQNNISFSVFPNMTADKITIILTNTYTDAEIFVHDMQGRMVWQTKLVGSRESIDVSGLHEGMYLITLLADKQRYTTKFIKTQQ